MPGAENHLLDNIGIVLGEFLVRANVLPEVGRPNEASLQIVSFPTEGIRCRRLRMLPRFLGVEPSCNFDGDGLGDKQKTDALSIASSPALL